MMRKGMSAMVLLLVLLAGCGKKGPAQAAVSEASKKFLPPDPMAYVELDVRALLGAALFKAPLDAALAGLPAECRTMLDAAEKVSLAAYGSVEDLAKLLMETKKEEVRGEGPEAEGPAPSAPAMPDVAVLFSGPTKAQLLGCIGAVRPGSVTTREEQRDGQAITFLTTPRGEVALISPEETTHVMAAPQRLDATLAALGGGPTIDGSPLLAAVGTVPAGAIVGAANIPESLAAMMTEGLAMFAGGKPIPPPRTVAGSVTLGEAMDLAAAITMADEASAQSLEGIANTAISGAKTLLTALGGDSPTAKSLKPVLDSISVSRSGASVAVRVRISREVFEEMFLSRSSRREPPPPNAP
jgi:hypothetical protein